MNMAYGEWSHCTECGVQSQRLDMHGVCRDCNAALLEDEKKLQSECLHLGVDTFAGREICRYCGKDFGYAEPEPF